VGVEGRVDVWREERSKMLMIKNVMKV
jgi:hypothetical protein